MSIVASPQFYVYILCRPNGKPFYVGKGKASRVHDHETEARRGHKCHKCNLIRKILKAGDQIQRYIVFTTDDEQEAYAYECELIASYGRKNLTNQTDGGEGAGGVQTTLETRQKRHVIMKARYDDPAERVKTGKYTKAVWADPVYHEQRRADLERRFNEPEIRGRRRVLTAKSWEQPEIRERRGTAIRTALADPEIRARRSAISKANWANPEYRAKMAAKADARRTPEARAKQGASLKATLARMKAEGQPRRMQPQAKLNEDAVRDIRSAHARGVSQGALARQYGVKYQTIAALLHGKTWTHVK